MISKERKDQPVGTKKIRKGDVVMAITGNERGRVGTVQSRKGDRAIVQGFNLRKKHIKRSQTAPQGGLVEIESSIHISNLKVCADGQKPVKLKVHADVKGDRHLVHHEGDKKITYRSVKKPK